MLDGRLTATGQAAGQTDRQTVLTLQVQDLNALQILPDTSRVKASHKVVVGHVQCGYSTCVCAPSKNTCVVTGWAWTAIDP